VQLECGEYESIRFHLRLFPAGAWTMANAHFEVLIPGTTDHQVLSWNLAKQLVLVDLQRTGLLDPGVPFGAALGLTPAPAFREIPAMIYNGLPTGLRGLIGGPPGNVDAGVGISNDGTAIIANLADRAVVDRGTARHDFEVAFDQLIPKPFCAGSPTDWVHAEGPVRFTHRVVTSPQGEVSTQIQVVGSLKVTPVNIQTGVVTGESRKAQVTDHYTSATLGRSGRVSSAQLRLITASSGAAGSESEHVRLRVGPDGRTDFSREERCLP
jgi:hypothetical protein